MLLTVYRNGQPLTQFEIDENTVFTHKLMGEHKIVSDFISHEVLPVQIGDYIEHKAERFYINTPPEVEKFNNFTYRYIIQFEGEIYRLYSKIFMDEGVADFSYHGTPEDFLLLLLENINSIDPGWAIEKVDDAPAQTLGFNGATCRTALSAIAEAFGLEYRLVNKNIYLERSVGADTILQFQYGRGRGLYHLHRNKIEDKNVVTRVYGFGARKNLNYDYREGLSRLVFEERKLEKNTDLYGIREGSVTLEEIYPQRTGTVTAVEAGDVTVIKDQELDFNINNYLLEGVVAKIVFKTGHLAGYEFEILSYRHTDRRIKFIPFVEENGYTLPNDLNFPEVGDQYTLVDIKMPQIYIDEAEIKLRERTQEYLDENSVPRVIYNLSIDEKYVRERGIDLRVADLVRVMDEGLGINSKIRVAQVSYPLVNEDKVTAVIADSIPYTIQEQLISDNVDNNTEIVNVDRRQVELARRSALRFRELQKFIFDPDGYFDPETIKPGSIETLMLSVGARSQNFGLIGVTIEANAGGNPNTLKISGGQLAHYQIEIEGLGYVWEMDPRTFTGLDPDKHYYVYARCSATSLVGTWELSEEPQLVDAEEGHYLFNLGILYKVVDGRRDFDFTNGMTYINGDTITTGSIKSLDGLNYFDLSGGKFKIGNEESSLDWNVTKPGQLTLKGVLVSSFVIAENAVIENLTVRNLKTWDEGKRIEITRDSNSMIYYDKDNRPVIIMQDGVDTRRSSQSYGLSVVDPDEDLTSTVSAAGLYSDASSVRSTVQVPNSHSRDTVSVRSSIVGFLKKLSNGISSGITGINTHSNENAWAGYFNGGLLVDGLKGLVMRSGFHYRVQRIDQSVTLDETSYFVSCYNSQSIAVYLPANPRTGRTIIVKRNHATVIVNGNGKGINRTGIHANVGVGNAEGDKGTFTYDGFYWTYNLERM